MRLLLLGGYRFLGRAVVDCARERGHAVTAFNRGSQAMPAGVDVIRGDRDAPAALRRGAWDAVIDTSGYVPRHVREAAELLRETIERYVFVSSLSVYAEPYIADFDESAPRAELPAGIDPATSEVTMETYGALKALCEDAAEEVMPDRSIAVRAGFIVGPYDVTDRFNSWIERAARDEAMLVAGDPEAPLQLIDVRDIAAWIVGAAEQCLSGAYNVTAPAEPMTALDVAATCIAGTASGARAVAVPSEIVRSAGVVPGQHIPFWHEPDEYGLMQANIDRALATGLHARPLIDTVRDTYAWLQTSNHPRRVSCPIDFERAALQFQLRG